MLEQWKSRARHLQSESIALYLAARDPRTPWYTKLLVAVIIAYALSPIDLIPDFVPVFGYLDDLILIPLGIALAIRLVPRRVLQDCRRRAKEIRQQTAPASRLAAAVIILIWLVILIFCAVWLYRILQVAKD